MFFRFFQLVVSHPAFSKDEDLQKVLKEENLAVRSKVKKSLRTSLYHELWMISGIIVTSLPRNTNNQKLFLLVRILMKNFRRKEILWRSTHHLPRRHMGILLKNFRRKEILWKSTHHLPRRHMGILLKNFRRKEILWKSTHHLPRRHMGTSPK
nr:uncharacterized protein LOC131787180 isoform X3 [Pocillopora verrucosa]